MLTPSWDRKPSRRRLGPMVVGLLMTVALGVAPAATAQPVATAQAVASHPASTRPAGTDPPPDSTPGTLSTATPSVAAGTSIAFTYSTPSANVPVANDNWIGLYSASAGCAPVDNSYGGCGSTTWGVAPNASGALTFDTTSLAAGTYYAYYLYDNEYSSLAPFVTFSVTAAAPTGTLTTKTPTLTQGATLTFAYSTSAATVNAENWIGLYSNPGCGPVDGVDVCSSTIWQYTPGKSGTATFSTASLSPGKYVAFYLYDNEYTSLAVPVDFTVKAIKPVAPATYVSTVETKVALDDPQDVVQGQGGRLWVADTGDNRVEEISATTGRLIRTLGRSGAGAGRLDQPRAVAVSGSFVFVADTGHNRVEEYTKEGKWVATIGRRGTADGQFEQPEGVAARHGILYVSDDLNNRIETFTINTGAYRSSLTGAGDVSSPAGLSFDSKGHLWAAQQGQTDTALDGVVELSPQGKVLLALDDNNTTTLGGFTDPSDVATDAKGNILVADPDLDYVEEFNPDGVFLDEFGTSGRGELAFPAAVTVTKSGRILVVDSGNNRLVMFRQS